MQINAEERRDVVSSPWHSLWNQALQMEQAIHFRPLASWTSSQNRTLQIPQGVMSCCFPDFLRFLVTASFRVFTTLVLFFLTSLEAGACFFLFRGFGFDCMLFSSTAFLYGELVRTSAFCDFFWRRSACLHLGYGDISRTCTRCFPDFGVVEFWL